MLYWHQFYYYEYETYVELGLKLLHGFDTAREGKDLTAADLFTLDSTQKGTHVVTGFSLKE